MPRKVQLNKLHIRRHKGGDYVSGKDSKPQKPKLSAKELKLAQKRKEQDELAKSAWLRLWQQRVEGLEQPRQ